MSRRDRALRLAKRRYTPDRRPEVDEDDLDGFDSMDNFMRAADRYASRQLPSIPEMDEWDYDRRARRQREHQRDQEPHKPLVSEAVLRVLVGDLAPHASGVLNVLQTNETARTAAATASVGLAALVLPSILK
jgi:hypothetical protein